MLSSRSWLKQLQGRAAPSRAAGGMDRLVHHHLERSVAGYTSSDHAARHLFPGFASRGALAYRHCAIVASAVTARNFPLDFFYPGCIIVREE